MNKEKDVVFWSVEDYVEELRFGTIEECLENYVAGFDLNKKLLDKVEVFGWKRLKIKDDYAAEMVLKKLLERWDEDYGNFDDFTEPTKAMGKVAKRFVNAIKKEYKVWRCEQVCKKTIILSDYLEARNEISRK